MTDRQLEDRLRSWYREELEAEAAAPPSLRSGVAAIPRGVSRRPRRSGVPRSLALLVAATLASVLALGAFAIGSGLVRLPAITTVSPSPRSTPAAVVATAEPTVEPTIAPTLAATPTATPTYNWPGARENAPGSYSWSVTRGETRRMHRHNALGDAFVDVTFRTGDGSDPAGPTATAVAGFPGTHRSLPSVEGGPLVQTWTFDVKGTTVVVTVSAKPGTAAADIAEAVAVVESLRAIPAFGNAGLLLVFDLGEGWDSG